MSAEADDAFAEAVREALAGLVAAINAARTAGLMVQAEVWQQHEPGRPDPNPRITLTVARPL